MTPVRIVTIAAALAVCATGCGPKVSLEIGVNERPVDLKQERPAAAPVVVEQLPPVTAAPSERVSGTNAPGFVAAPVVVDRPTPAADGNRGPTRPCKVANGQLAAAEPAPAVPTRAPVPGRYPFRRIGVIDVVGQRSTLTPTITRTIKAVEQVLPTERVRGQIRFQQVEEEPGATTTTTYRIDQPVVAPDGTVAAPGGIFIEQVVTERPFATTAPDVARGTATGGSPFSGRETFTPTPPVQIAALPFAEERPVGDGLVDPPPHVSGGVDPVNGTAMAVRSRTLGHTRIDACGDVFDAWEVEIHPDSRFVNAGIRTYHVDGRIAFAPQLGGMVVSDQLHFAGNEATIPYDLRTASTISSRTPEKRA